MKNLITIFAILALAGCKKSSITPQNVEYVQLEWSTTDGKEGRSNIVAVYPE